jgi:MFS family permease
MKTAIWLYLFLFVAFFDLHAQYPMLSPFALSLGAAPSFIGLILGVYSITHLPGNVIAGFGVDRFGSKKFIVISLILAGIVLLFQSQVTNPWELLVIRSISGFTLAFLSPACLSLLAKLAKDRVQQGKLMAGNGLVHTLASVVSPAAGAYLVARIGFSQSFTILGWILIGTGVLAIFGVREGGADFTGDKNEAFTGHHAAPLPDRQSSLNSAAPESSASPGAIPWLFYGIPLALSCAQGILFFELPLIKQSLDNILTSGILFSLVSLGALLTLSMMFLNKMSSFYRTIIGSLALALTFFGMAIQWPIPLYASLFMIGMSKGVIFPAMSTLLAAMTTSDRYGRVFSLLSISFSLGAFFGPVIAGHLRANVSPYYIAFLALILALAFIPFHKFRALAAV